MTKQEKRAKLNAYNRKYYKNNKKRVQAICKKSYEKNKVLHPRIKLTKEQLKINKSETDRKYREKNKKKLKIKKAQYYQKNKEEINKKNSENLKNDINKRLAHNLRTRLNMTINSNCKAGSGVRDLGCSIDDFKKYIESKWLPGMNWDNWGKERNNWQLDHIIPLSHFDLTDREQFLRASNFTNYQPLWAEKNWSKNRYI